MAFKDDLAAVLGAEYPIETGGPDGIVVATGADWLSARAEVFAADALAAALEGRAVEGYPLAIAAVNAPLLPEGEQLGILWSMIEESIVEGIRAAVHPQIVRPRMASHRNGGLTAGMLIAAPLGYRLGKALKR